MVQIIKRTEQIFEIKSVAINYFSKESILKVRKEKTCFKCNTKFINLKEDRISLGFSTIRNLLLCHKCAVELNEKINLNN